MRDYLKELNIVGGVGVWSEGEICRFGIETLIKHCNKVVIMQDNSDDKTKAIVEEYRIKYPDQVVVGNTNLPPCKEGERIMSRQKNYEGEIIQECFNLIRTEHEKKHIDLMIFCDSDEMFTDSFPEGMERFWKSSADVMFIKPIEVFDGFDIIVNKGLVSHAKVYKYVPEISSIPYSAQNFYLPYRKNRNIVKYPYLFVHCARLTKENRDLRIALRGRHSSPDNKLRKISKPAWELTPEEHQALLDSPLFIRLQDWDGTKESIPLVL